MGGGPPPKPEPRMEDVPLIQCAACKATVRRAFHVAKTLRAGGKGASRAVVYAALVQRSETGPRHVLVGASEMSLLTAIAPRCDTSAGAGEWLHDYDMQEQTDGTVALKRMSSHGECGVECIGPRHL